MLKNPLNSDRIGAAPSKIPVRLIEIKDGFPALLNPLFRAMKGSQVLPQLGFYVGFRDILVEEHRAPTPKIGAEHVPIWDEEF